MPASPGRLVAIGTQIVKSRAPTLASANVTLVIDQRERTACLLTTARLRLAAAALNMLNALSQVLVLMYALATNSTVVTARPVKLLTTVQSRANVLQVRQRVLVTPNVP